MTAPADPRSAESRSWPRHGARLSLLAPFVCFALNCTVNQFVLRQGPDEGVGLSRAAGYLSLGIVMAGLALGLAAAVVAFRRRAYETLQLALLGAALNAGVLLVTWLAQAMLARGR